MDDQKWALCMIGDRRESNGNFAVLRNECRNIFEANSGNDLRLTMDDSRFFPRSNRASECSRSREAAG
jgi:hypothetical protein